MFYRDLRSISLLEKELDFDKLCCSLAQPCITFADMKITYYCRTIEDALKRAKQAGKRPGCYYGGITLRSGKKGFAIYREGKVVEQYSVIGTGKRRPTLLSQS